MCVINLNEYRERRLLRNFRQTGEHDNRLLKSQGGEYDREAVHYNHMLHVVCREREVMDIYREVSQLSKKYTTFGLKGKYRSAPIFYVLLQESERILFTQKRYRSVYDWFLLEHIQNIRNTLLVDLQELLTKFEAIGNVGSDERITSIRTKLASAITYFSK